MQKHSRLLCEALADYSEIELFVLHPHEEKIFDHSFISEVFIRGIESSKNYLHQSYLYSKRVYGQLQLLKPDIVYSQGLSVWYKANDFKGKLIINPHGLEPYQAIGFKNQVLGWPFRMIFNNLFRKATVTISLGGRLSSILKRVAVKKSRIVEIPNAVTLPALPAERNFAAIPLRGLFLARFAHNKGIDILFEAIEELNRRGLGHSFHFILGGKGPLYEFYKNRQNSTNVSLLGFVRDEDIPRIYREADFFVFPTLFEGMPTVVLEAMSYGLPVIVSDVGATKVLVDDSNGKIIEPGSVASLVAALEWFLQTSVSEKAAMSRAAYGKVSKDFIWPKVAERHYQLFRELYQSGADE